jgi:DUF971 family protein
VASPALTEVRRVPAAGRLQLTWSDGHSAAFDYGYLRGWCPCALCQGHTALALTFHPAAGPVAVTSVQPVGNYGIAIGFSDGHSTGIYRFEFLREICPCAVCRREGPPAPATAS